MRRSIPEEVPPDPNVVVLATWAPTENETGTLIHYARAVRPITEMAVRAHQSNMAFPGDPHSSGGSAESWRMVREGHERQITLIGHTNQMGDFVMGVFRYSPTWRTLKFRLNKPQRSLGRDRQMTDRRLKYLISAWHLLLGQPLDSMELLRVLPQLTKSFTGPGDRGIQKNVDRLYALAPPLTFAFDAGSYALLGLPPPWLDSHDDFMAWMSAER